MHISIVTFFVIALFGVQCFDLFTNPDFAYSPDTPDVDERTCSFKGNRSEGVCRLIDDCPGAVSDFTMNNLMPSHCGFRGRVPVVCCALPKIQVNIGNANVMNRISATRK